MTTQQLVAARPAAHPISASGRSAYLNQCDYADAPLTIADMKFRVCETLRDNKVNSVILNGELQDKQWRVDNLKILLARRYGTPAIDHCTYDKGFSCSTVWKRDNVTITLASEDLLNKKYWGNVYYEAAADDVQKL